MEARDFDPQRYRHEAVRTRRLAGRMHDDALRQQLLGVASDYDNLAITVELLAEQRRLRLPLRALVAASARQIADQ